MNEPANAIYLLLMLVLVGSSFAARRVPIAQTLKMLIGWIGIFALGFIIVGFRHDLGDLFGSRLFGRAVVSGNTVRIPMAEDGHFWVDARINGAAVHLMVDSGATMTTLSAPSAEKAGIAAADGMPELVGTANGMIQVARARADTIEVGSIVMRSLDVHIAPGDDFNVIGMNFLSKLSRWTVEGRWLILTP